MEVFLLVNEIKIIKTLLSLSLSLSLSLNFPFLWGRNNEFLFSDKGYFPSNVYSPIV